MASTFATSVIELQNHIPCHSRLRTLIDFHKRFPYKILNHYLGLNSNPKVIKKTNFAEKFQRRTKIDFDPTKNIMKSHLNYEKYYDRKSKAAPLQQNDTTVSYFIQLQTTRSQEVLFQEYRWIEAYIVENVLTNENYIVRKFN